MRVLASLISVLFHPLMMLTYMLILMLAVNPFMFGYTRIAEADTLILMVFLTSALIPLIAILVMKGIGWVGSLQMPDRHERIGPYIVTGVLYLTLYLHLAKAKAFPQLLLIATLGSVIALFAGFLFNNFRKVSMHATAAGGLIILSFLLYTTYSTPTFLIHLPGGADLECSTAAVLYTALLLGGMICSSRLIIQKHSPGEVYTGLVIGIAGMLASAITIG